MLIVLACVGAFVSACSRAPKQVTTDWLWHTEEELADVFGEPVDIEYEGDFKILSFLREEKLEDSPDLITSKTHYPDPTGRFYQGPITSVQLHDGEKYMVVHRFWVSQTGIIHRFESQIQ
jgi:hypothetical protein